MNLFVRLIKKKNYYFKLRDVILENFERIYFH